MKKEVGLWMDHRKAVIVVITDNGEEIKSYQRLKSSSDALRVHLSRVHMKHSKFPADDSCESVYWISQHLLIRKLQP